MVFNKLKYYMMYVLILVYVDYNKEFEFYIDVSIDGLGVVFVRSKEESFE